MISREKMHLKMKDKTLKGKIFKKNNLDLNSKTVKNSFRKTAMNKILMEKWMIPNNKNSNLNPKKSSLKKHSIRSEMTMMTTLVSQAKEEDLPTANQEKR